MQAESILQPRRTGHAPVLGAVALALLTCAAVAKASTDTDADLSTTASADSYAVPLFLSTDDSRRHGFLRIVNRSNRDGSVRIYAIDDAGARFGPVELDLAAESAAHINSNDLERGNAEKGLSGGVGAGQGQWRLELATDLDILARSYVRTDDGFVTRLHGTSTLENDNTCVVDFFNPSSNHNQVSELRLANPSDRDAQVVVAGMDDQGQDAPDGEVHLTLPARETHAITAYDLEAGAGTVFGRLGDGVGKWRLSLSSDRPIEITNLLHSPTGYVTVASTCEESVQRGGVVVSEDGLDDTSAWGTDTYELGEVAIVDDTLKATVSYGGGCRDHEFTLVLSNAFRMTDPVRLPAKLVHEADDDPCEAWLTENLVFDLAKVKQLHGDQGGQGSSIILMLATEDGNDHELRYEF